MHDPRLDKLADVLVRHSADLQPGEKALINGTTEAAPLAEAVARRVLAMGGHPYIRLSAPSMSEYLLRNGSEEQLRHVPQSLVAAYAEADKTFNLMTPNDAHRLLGLLPESRRNAFFDGQRAFREKKDAARAALGHSASGGGCCDTAVMAPYPTAVAAERACMTLAEFEDYVFNACLADADDPVGYWRSFRDRQQSLVDALDGTSSLRVVADGTDLRLSIAGRQFVNASGQGNLPDGEIYIGPVEGSAEGRVTFNLPTFWQGARIEGMQLELEAGRVTRAAAATNDDVLQAALSTDDGARNVGEFALGTNSGILRPIGDALFDEKIAGTFHIALGGGIAGNKNGSMIHWDIVSDLRDGGEVYADDRLIYRNGNFMI